MTSTVDFDRMMYKDFSLDSRAYIKQTLGQLENRGIIILDLINGTEEDEIPLPLIIRRTEKTIPFLDNEGI